MDTLQNKRLDKKHCKTKFDNIKELVNASVTAHKNNNAFVINHGNSKNPDYEYITYGRMGEDIKHLGTALITRYPKKQHIAVIGKNCYGWVLGYFATINSGNVIVPLDKGLPLSEIESSLIRSKTTIVFFEKAQLAVAETLLQQGSTNVDLWICMDADKTTACAIKEKASEKILTIEELIKQGRALCSLGIESFDSTVIDASKAAIILFTSGTTSKSKAVMLSHRNICENIYAFTSCMEILPNDMNLAFLPYHHTYGATVCMISILSCGACNAFCDGLKYLHKNLVEYKISIFMSVPLLVEALYKKIVSTIKKNGHEEMTEKLLAQSKALLEKGQDQRKELFSYITNQMGGNLRLIMTAAGPADPKAIKALNDFGILTVQAYGLTETAPLLTTETETSLRNGSVGKALPNVQLKISNPDHKGIGEVAVKGPNVMLGYYKNALATEECMIDGWFHTGDLGYIDQDGYLFLRGRKKNVIVLKSGKNIYPEEIESLVSNLPYVAECMVCGVPRHKNNPDDITICLKLVYNSDYVKSHMPGCSIYKVADEDIDKINSTMPAYKQIKKLIVTDEPMIKTSTSKIKRLEELTAILKCAV